MRNLIYLIILVLSLSGCASLLTTTGTSGVAFGMSKEQVLKKIGNKYRVISQNDNTIVAEGSHDLIDQKVIKTFIFEDNRLVIVDDKF